VKLLRPTFQRPRTALGALADPVQSQPKVVRPFDLAHALVDIAEYRASLMLVALSVTVRDHLARFIPTFGSRKTAESARAQLRVGWVPPGTTQGGQSVWPQDGYALMSGPRR
jgi:hypothetical protein